MTICVFYAGPHFPNTQYLDVNKMVGALVSKGGGEQVARARLMPVRMRFRIPPAPTPGANKFFPEPRHDPLDAFSFTNNLHPRVYNFVLLVHISGSAVQIC